MKTLSFELTMPNIGSWNGKWTGADKKYYIIKSISDKYYNKILVPLFENNHNWYYNFGDGWGANIELQFITSKEVIKRRKLSKGFAGYDWMVDSILRFGEILTESQRKERILSENNK
jgi:hypothetical protein